MLKDRAGQCGPCGAVSMHENKPPRMLPGRPGQAFASWGVELDSEVTFADTARGPGQAFAGWGVELDSKVTFAATVRGPGQIRGPRPGRHRCGGRKQRLFWSDGFCVFYAVGNDIAGEAGGSGQGL